MQKPVCFRIDSIPCLGDQTSWVRVQRCSSGRGITPRPSWRVTGSDDNTSRSDNDSESGRDSFDRERDVHTDDSESATVPCSPGGVNATMGSRFFRLADECDDTLSDTESVGEDSPPCRRLRLLWQAQAHTEAHRDVQVASHLIHALARRIGHVVEGDPIPRAIRQQRLSPFNVPLFWSAAGSVGTTPLLEWMMEQGVNESVTFHGGREGFPRCAAGNHISARAQEHILSSACAADGRVYTATAIVAGRQMAPPVSRAPVLARRRPVRSSGSVQDESWAQFDNIDVQEVFQQRVPMLKTCAHFLRGRLRHSFFIALHERLKRKLEVDPVGEERAWKLFALVPIMILHRPRNTGSVGRSELAQRVEDFVAGRWSELLTEARREVVRSGEPQCKGDEKARRGAAAQRRVERGQISRASQVWLPRTITR